MSDDAATHFPWPDKNSLVVIHQATGVYMELLGVPAEFAMARLVNAAEEAGQTVLEFSWRVVHPRAP